MLVSVAEYFSNPKTISGAIIAPLKLNKAQILRYSFFSMFLSETVFEKI